jgi:hypothetical protein
MPGGPDGTAGSIAPSEAAGLGETLLLAGRPFHAHEVFEDAWKGAAGPERDLWRGLAQIAVGLTHARRGNARGAISLLRRGAAGLRDYASQAVTLSPYGIDVTHVAARADGLAAQIDAGGLEQVPASAFLLSLDARRGS